MHYFTSIIIAMLGWLCCIL